MSGFSWDLLQIRQPLWLLLALQPILILAFLRIMVRRHSQQYADKELLKWVTANPDAKTLRRSRRHFALFQLIWILFAIAMAGPRYPDPPQAVDHASGVDVMVVMDVSRSMTATDIKPSRLKRAKAELFQMLTLNQSDRLGIILYAGRAHLMSPLTWDRNALQFYAKGVEYGLMPTAGSNLVAAIKLANRHLQDSPKKAIFLITDGETGQALEKEKALLQTPLFILGVGSHEGASIPDADSGWLMQEQQPVRTRLEDAKLSKLAEASGGAYVVMTDDMTDLEQLYMQGISRINANSFVDADDKQAWVELYSLFAIPAGLILLLVMVNWQELLRRNANLLLLCLLAGSVAFPDSASSAELSSADQQKAVLLFKSKDYRGAIDIYSLSSGYLSRMGEGASAYRLQDYASAITQFTQAFLVAGNDTERADALYNLANSFFLSQRYDAALMTYKDVLGYQQDHIDAMANMEFTASVIKSLMDDPFYDPGQGRRAGRGPRSARVAENAAGSGDFSLGEEELQQQTLYEKIEQDDVALEVIAAGKGQAKVADAGINRQEAAAQRTVSAVDLLEARRQVLQAKQDQSSLWQALFEDEEGFPAPVEQPVVLPGLSPW